MELKDGLVRTIHRLGSVEALPEMSGPRLETWNPRLLAEALDSEIARCAVEGWPKISLHMDVRDAMKLAQFLRKA